MSGPLMMTNERLILLHQNFTSAQEVISTLGALAKEHGLVDDNYLPAILEREENFPTGLELPINIAIPHIDTGVKRPFVSIATLDRPVTFLNMDHSGDILETKIVFMFGILNPKDQLEILKRFARLFAQKDKIQALVNANSKKELIDSLNELLDNMLIIESI